MKIEDVFTITLIIALLFIIGMFINVIHYESIENKNICNNHNGVFVKDDFSRSCIINNEMYQIVDTEHGKRLVKQ